MYPQTHYLLLVNFLGSGGGGRVGSGGSSGGVCEWL